MTNKEAIEKLIKLDDKEPCAIFLWTREDVRKYAQDNLGIELSKKEILDVLLLLSGGEKTIKTAVEDVIQDKLLPED